MIEWKDTTSYSQGDKERIPTSFAVTINDIDVTIHRCIGCGDMLFLTSRALKISQHDLKTLDYDEAKSKALKYVSDLMLETINKYNLFISKVEKEANGGI